MLNINLKKLYFIGFAFIYLFVFFLTGGLQFFIGFPYVGISFLLIGILFFYLLISINQYNYAKLDKVVLSGLLYTFIILISGIINHSDTLHVLIYLFYPILPTFFYLFLKYGIRKKLLFQKRISKILLYTACIQLLFVVFQRFSYDFMKGFNNSGQALKEVDFWFGTFPLKADHALGLFILFNILNIYWYNKKLKLTRFPWMIMSWLTLTVFLTDSKITQLIIALLFIIHAYFAVPKKIRIIGVVTVLITAFATILLLKQVPILNKEYEYAKKAYTLKNTRWSVEENNGLYARRINVVMYFMHYESLKYIGNGPYDYFNFKEGKFKNTHHFSQLIWTYNDLGIFGLLSVIVFLYLLTKSLALSRWRTALIFIVLIVYSFMTVVLFDFAMMIAVLLILNQNFIHEPDSNTIS